MRIPDISEATAVFSDAFQFPGMSLNPEAPAYIERDRVIMAARPGMIRKLLPIREDPSGVFCGGCYLFDTWENARDYADWVADEFVLDGTLFLDRPEFLEPTSQLWRIVGATDFAEVSEHQNVMRFERWHVPADLDAEQLRAEWWPKIEEAARAAGVATVWLLAGTDEFHPQLGVVTSTFVDPAHATENPPTSLEPFAETPSVAGELAEALKGTKVFDRTSWIYMLWFPIEEGDESPDTALWPVSPPLPGLS